MRDRSAETRQPVVRCQVELRLGRVHLVLQVDVTDLEVVLRLLEIGALAERARNRGLQIDWFRRRCRSTGFSDEVHNGSSVPLTIRRFNASSEVLTVACDSTSVFRRDAASACADTTSIGASVPISTRDWLSWINRLAKSNEFWAASTA